MTDGSHVDEEFREGVALWEAGRYLEAHEAFEQLWLTEVGPCRHLLRGLIHAAMGFHYVTVGDTVSAWSKLRSASSLLQSFIGDFLGWMSMAFDSGSRPHAPSWRRPAIPRPQPSGAS